MVLILWNDPRVAGFSNLMIRVAYFYHTAVSSKSLSVFARSWPRACRLVPSRGVKLPILP